jgi:hypothetical protein
MADALITTADILLALDGSTEQLRRLAGDNGAGIARTDRVDYGIAVASEEAYGILIAGFDSVERVQALAAEDVLVRHAIVMIFRFTLADGKDGFRDPASGRCIFEASARAARDALRAKASGAKRTSAETVPGVGQSGLLRPRTATNPAPSLFTDRCGRPVGF